MASMCRNEKADIVIGVDPDVDRNGCALLDIVKRSLNVNMLRFPDLIEYIVKQEAAARSAGRRLLVVVEAGWMNRCNFHIARSHGKQGVASLGVDQGRNEQVGRLIGEMMDFYGVPYEFKLPLCKCWSGRDRKITKEEIEQVVGQKLGRINQEGRDAALLAWAHAGLPIRYKAHTVRAKDST